MAASVVAGSCHVARASLSIAANGSPALRDASRFLSCAAGGWRGTGCIGAGGQPTCGRGAEGGRIVVSLASASAPVTITASRVAEKADTVRVFGPGVAALPGFGRLLALDEFFVNPSNLGLPLGEDGAMLESLVYYLEEEKGADMIVEEEPFPQSRHGVQLHYLSSLSLFQSISPCESTSGSGRENTVVPSLFHVRRPSTVPEFLMEEGNEGGAVVKLVSGGFGGSIAPAPLHDFLLLDIVMRPGSVAKFPAKPNSGILIYVLEGVGLFNSSSETVSYQNEGHGLWLSPSYLASAGEGVVQFRSIAEQMQNHVFCSALGLVRLNPPCSGPQASA